MEKVDLLLEKVAEKFLDGEYKPSEFINMTEAAFDKYSDQYDTELDNSMSFEEACDIIDGFDVDESEEDDIFGDLDLDTSFEFADDNMDLDDDTEFFEAAISNVAEGLSDAKDIAEMCI